MIIIETPSQFETVEVWESFLDELQSLARAEQTPADRALIDQAIKEAENFLRLRAKN